MTAQKFPTPNFPKTPQNESERGQLNKRLETIGWALFLIMLGGVGLIPNEVVPEGTWLIGVGMIMLGLNGSRYFYGIRMSSGTIFLGVLALIAGIGDLLGLNLPIVAVVLILIGLSELSKAFFEKKIE